jgi:predicted Zn-dependent protease
VTLRWLSEQESSRRGSRACAVGSAVVILALLAGVSYRSATVWRSDITAWTRVADRHPWSVTAHTMLGQAYLAQGDVRSAERLFVESTRINPNVPDPYLELAELYLDHGDRARAGYRPGARARARAESSRCTAPARTDATDLAQHRRALLHSARQCGRTALQGDARMCRS